MLILSARSDLATKLRGFELGARRLHAEAVLARRAARARFASSCAAPRPFGDDGNVVRAGQLVARPRAPAGADRRHVCDLSDREFRLLHHLACTPAR